MLYSKFKVISCYFIILIIICTTNAQAQVEDSGFTQVTAFENYIHAKCKEVMENGKTTDKLTKNDLADLPVGIARQVGNTTYIIAIDSAYRAERGGWFFSAYASVTFPGTTKPIAFAAKNIAFNKRGLSASTQIKLMLASPQNFPINEQLSIELPADGRNFIEFNCDGFSAINLKGNFLFSGLLVPDKDLATKETRVKASFEINTRDINNILTTVNITPFKIRGLDDLSFEVQNAVADFSDIANPSGFIFPQEYQHSYGSDIMLWRGFYLKNVKVRVKGFASEPGRDPSLEAKNLIIDDLGVSGSFSASEMLTLYEGSADGWSLSVDHIMIKLLFSKLAGGGLGGKMIIPFLGETPVPYTAQMEQVGKIVNYRFAVDTSKPISFKTPLGAYINVDAGSTIMLEKTDGKFYPSALLQGSISVKEEKIEGEAVSDGNTPLKNIPVSADKISFQDLHLVSQKPYIIGGVFSNAANKQATIAGFKVRIEEVKLQVYQGRAGIGFDMAIGFMESGDKGFSAGTTVQLLAKMEETPKQPSETGIPSGATRQKWKFEKVKIDDVILSCNTKAFGLNGRISIFDDDPNYGNGFRGNLIFSIKKVLEQGVKVNAYFGSKDNFRYWHVDAFVPTAEIPILPPVSMKGIMGGASYKMTKNQPANFDFSKLSPEKPGNLSTGTSSTDMEYLPDEKAGISFLAGLTLIIGEEKAINGDVILEVAFNPHGGIRYAQFTGTTFFFTAIKDRGRAKGTDGVASAPVYADLNMLYDNDNDVFHANLKTYMNMSGVIQGTGPGGMIGEAVIHVDRRDWYVYIGRASQMMGVNVANLATAQAYFMIGTKIENLPLPPPEVREIFGKIDLSLMRDDLAAAGGKGIATGVHFKVGFDSGTKLKPFYAMMVVGAGADIMLRNYGNSQCAGRSGKIGMNGWYASGQAYVFLKGKVGIMVKSTPFDIVDLGVAALLQAKLPNPAWMSGNLAGKYKVLGGLVKGNFHLKFNVGEECEIINPGEDISEIFVIADLKPDNGGTELSVFTAPQVSFNTSIDTEFTMEDMVEKVHTYKVKIEEFKILNKGTTLQTSIKWNAQKDVAVLKTDKILPPNSNLNLIVKVFWQKKAINGTWENIKDDKGKIIFEERQLSFSTGDAPKYVPEENVAYSYPIKYQYNLHTKEAAKGYVKLDQDQDYLFKDKDEAGTWEYYARFRDNKGIITETALAYDFSSYTINFDFPSTFEKNAIYALTVIKKSKGGAIDQNVKRNEVLRRGTEGNEMSMTSNSLEGTITQSSETVLYNTVFRTSQFDKFSERWAALSNSTDAFDVAKGNVAVIGKRSSSSEVFDDFELRGKEGMLPLVQVVASQENRWFKDVISPLIYDLYPYEARIKIDWRDPEVLGVKPLKGVQLTTGFSNLKLTDAEASSGYAPAKSGSVLIGYYLSFYTFWDYSNLLNQIAAIYPEYTNNRPEGVKRIMASKGYTDLLEGNYPVDVQYVMPGTNKVLFKNQISIKF